MVVTCPNTSVRDIMLYSYQRDSGLEWIKDLDRGRCNSYIHAYTTEEWSAHFEAAGLKVVEHLPHIPDIVFKVNDIGLRPLFPTFMHIYNVIKDKAPEDFREIKSRWIANCRHFLLPLIDESWMDQFGTDRHWHAFHLTKD